MTPTPTSEPRTKPSNGNSSAGQAGAKGTSLSPPRSGIGVADRGQGSLPAASATGVPAVAGRLPPGMKIVASTDKVLVQVDKFKLPLEKGKGAWIQQAYDTAGGGGRLVFTPVFEGTSVAAFKEGDENYKAIWLKNFGFKTERELAEAFVVSASTDKKVAEAYGRAGVAALIQGMQDKGLQGSGCDIDHIVEKQLQGTSIPSNLQLLVSDKNQSSGTRTYQELVQLVELVRAARGSKTEPLQFVFGSVEVPAGKEDPSFVVETELREGRIKGKSVAAPPLAGRPVFLSAGGVGETVQLKDNGPTSIDSMAKRIVPAVRLRKYVPGAAGARSKLDRVEGGFDARAFEILGTRPIHFRAELSLAAASSSSGAAPAPGAGAAVTPSETRLIQLDKDTSPKIAFYYPYLSPGEFSSLSVDAQGALVAEGTILPTLPLLRKLAVRFKAGGGGDEQLALLAPLGVDKLEPNNHLFRFTQGQLALQLSPSFLPSGKLAFEVGPKGKPILLGELEAKAESGVFVATGTLKPAGKVPGINDAEGQVSYRSDSGWAGKLSVKSSAIPGAVIDVELGLLSGKSGRIAAYGKGGLQTKLAGSDVSLAVGWEGGAVSYAGSAVIQVPGLHPVALKVRYDANGLSGSGKTGVSIGGLEGDVLVSYREGRISGTGTLHIRKGRAQGSVNVQLSEAGLLSGAGKATVRLTDNLIAEVTVKKPEQGPLRVDGELRFPKPITLFQGLSRSHTLFERSIEIGIPGLSIPLINVGVVATLGGRLLVAYGFGPGTLSDVHVKAGFNPLQEDSEVVLDGAAKLAIPAHIELSLGLRAGIGLSIKVARVTGGITGTGSAGLRGGFEGLIELHYKKGAFSVAAEAAIRARPVFRLALDADITAELGALGISRQWQKVWNLYGFEWGANVEAGLIARLGYASDRGLMLPAASDIQWLVPNIDAGAVLRDVFGRARSSEKG